MRHYCPGCNGHHKHDDVAAAAPLGDAPWLTPRGRLAAWLPFAPRVERCADRAARAAQLARNLGQVRPGGEAGIERGH